MEKTVFSGIKEKYDNIDKRIKMCFLSAFICGLFAHIYALTNHLYNYDELWHTPTGFGTGGATKEDVELFKKYIGPKVKIKAAGGVSSMEDLEMFLELGCDRIGTSRAVGLCKGELTEGY